MNWNENSPDDIQSELQRLRPAASAIDPKEIFYRAGFEAAKREQQNVCKKNSLGWSHLVVAAVLTAILAVPISYQLGQRQGLSMIAQLESIAAQSDTPDGDATDEAVRPVPLPAEVAKADKEQLAPVDPKIFVTPRRSRLSDLLFPSLEQPRRTTTLTAFRGTSFSESDTLNTWMNWPNPSLDRQRVLSNSSGDGDTDETMSTLAVGDTLRSLPRLTN
ncbi:MAG: hypothetical protein WBD20_07790 [Pirellulaceae bacterium]